MKQKGKYKSFNKIDKKTKKMIITIAILLLLIIFMNILINYLEDRKNTQNTNSNYSSIEEILEKYGCIYLGEKKSEEKEYLLDIYLKFKNNTFEGNSNNKLYYESIIATLSEFINDSYRLIDEDKNIIVEVKKYKNDLGEFKFIYSINGKSDYFKKEQSKLSLINFEEDKNTNIEINSIILQQLSDNNWQKSGIDFGTKDSSFNKYDMYFDEGIELRTISKEIYNIVFTEKYNEQVVNGIIPGTDFNGIISKLGEPTYGAKEGSYIGYKNNKMYVFFTEDTIEIYKNELADMTEFESILEKYINNKISIKEFMNELTYIWDDYEEYTYNESSIYINYPIKGIMINMTEDNPLGINVYKNCNMTDKISEFITAEKINANLQNDLVNQTFTNKLGKYNDYVYISEMIETSSEESSFIKGKSNLYSIYYKNENNLLNNILFLSKEEQLPNRELKEKINKGIFISDNLFVYSIETKGIYLINLYNGDKTTLVTGNEEFIIKEYQNQILKYDDKEIKLVME